MKDKMREVNLAWQYANIILSDSELAFIGVIPRASKVANFKKNFRIHPKNLKYQQKYTVYE